MGILAFDLLTKRKSILALHAVRRNARCFGTNIFNLGNRLLCNGGGKLLSCLLLTVYIRNFVSNKPFACNTLGFYSCFADLHIRIGLCFGFEIYRFRNGNGFRLGSVNSDLHTVFCNGAQFRLCVIA